MPINKKPLKSIKEEDSNKAMEFDLTEPLYDFDDLVLPKSVIDEIFQTIAIIEYNDLIYNSWGLGSVFRRKKNVSINLYGECGTGKTMAAHAIAHNLSRKILLVNYAEIESKYVGETSKNLVNLFEYAEKNNSVIAFDEADALLSRRVTDMRSATDVSVNQTRNVLLRILDDYTGVVVFTTNFIRNYDGAFLRRITSHIKFDMPDKIMRKSLWDHYIVMELPIDGNRDDIIDELSEIEGITGSDISSAVLKSAVFAAMSENKQVDKNCIKHELDKIVKVKKALDDKGLEGCNISTRMVSEDYVKEQINTGGVIDGTT